MVKKYVLTGGPGTGKSSIILHLEMKGEHVVRESAEDYIKLRQAQGYKEPWTEKDFQDKILELQLQREKRVPKNIGRVFIDRGILDGLAYYQIAGKEPSDKMTESLKEFENRYDKVFLIENLGACEKNEIRREDLEESVKIAEKQLENYTDYGYKVKKVPSLTVKERVEMILKEEKENETV